MPFIRLALQVLPVTAIGLLASVLGFWRCQPPADPGESLLRGLLTLLAFLGTLVFKRKPGWNILALAAFAVLTGCYASALDQGGPHNWWIALGSSLALAWLSGRLASKRKFIPGEFGLGMWLLIWVYVLGWPVMALVRLPIPLRAVWGGFGAALFCGLLAAWYARIRRQPGSDPGSALGIDLYLLVINLTLAVMLFLGAVMA